MTEYGLFKGQRLEEHIEALLFQATGVAHVTFRQLRELRPDVALRLTATSITHQRVTYFDVDATPDLAVARAVRASSAVPLLLAPVEIDGELFVDGGLLKNLPYDAFDLEGHPTLALSIRTPTAAELKSKDDDRKLALPTFSTFFAALLETLTFGEGSANCLSHALVRDGLDLVELGAYECAGCGAELYYARAKFDSGCGWPAFYDGVPGAIEEVPDVDGYRVEIVCAKCKGHLGHVFKGEGFPSPTDARHCVNGISLRYQPMSYQPDDVEALPAQFVPRADPSGLS